jgi:hypothetical protein
MNWVRFATAVYEAQSQLGISLAKAHEELSAAVENDKVTSRSSGALAVSSQSLRSCSRRCFRMGLCLMITCARC